MFERYTEKARRTVFFARYEVSQVGGDAIGPEHILLGLLREDKSFIPRLLAGREEAAKSVIRQQVAEHCGVGGKVAAYRELPLSPEAKQVLLYGHEESEGMSHRHIGTEHILLGLLRNEGSFAAKVLREQGVAYDGVRWVVREMYDA